jgi:RNA polymerase sigma-54 factor
MISQQQTQKQQLKILPQQIQLLNLFFLNTLELEQRIKNELEENPFLDQNEKKEDEANEIKNNEENDFQDYDEFMYEDVPDYKEEYRNYFNNEQIPEMPIISKVNFKEDAKQQLRLLDLDNKEREFVEFVIDMLNDDGMMDKLPEEVADDLSFQYQSIIEVNAVKRALEIIKTLEPIGIGSGSVQECLLIQLQAMNGKRPDVKCAIELIKNHYYDLIHRQFEKIHHALHIDDEEFRVILNLVGTLKFHPVTDNSSDTAPKNTIIPDFVITRVGDNTIVNLYSSRSSSVFVNQALYEQLSGQLSNKDKSANQYVRGKLQAAEWFVNAVKQREITMMKIMQCIVQLQKEYFIDGDISKLKPMVLRNIADVTGLDISTISRVTGNKYAETHFGLIYLKDVFSEGIADKKGEVVSNKVIQSVIEETISSEDKHAPYTDQQLVHILTSKGYNIARRTVAKYREQMHIPIAQVRAVWA